jgi:hypothetical protein
MRAQTSAPPPAPFDLASIFNFDAAPDGPESEDEDDEVRMY